MRRGVPARRPGRDCARTRGRPGRQRSLPPLHRGRAGRPSLARRRGSRPPARRNWPMRQRRRRSRRPLPARRCRSRPKAPARDACQPAAPSRPRAGPRRTISHDPPRASAHRPDPAAAARRRRAGQDRGRAAARPASRTASTSTRSRRASGFSIPGEVPADLPVELVDVSAAQALGGAARASCSRGRSASWRPGAFADRVREAAADADLVHLEETETAWCDGGLALPSLVHLHYLARRDRDLGAPWRKQFREVLDASTRRARCGAPAPLPRRELAARGRRAARRRATRRGRPRAALARPRPSTPSRRSTARRRPG